MESETLTIDMRSDTVTKPCPAMRKVMSEALVGDAVLGDDLTTLELEAKCAGMLGKEAGLFVPSGTLGNFLSVMAHCWGRGLEIMVGDKSHIYIYEQGNVAQFGGVHSRTLTNLPDGTFSTGELRAKIRPDDQLEPQTALICIENTHNKCGGKVLPLTWIREVGQICKDAGLPLHCDGARLFNASIVMGIPVKDLVKDCDSVSLCLSKGLGAPIGSVIVGSEDFIKRAHRLRKAVGGGMRQIVTMESETLTIDMRSDTVTKPCPTMRKVMSEALVGDAVFGDDLTTLELEAKCARMLGKEAGLFVPSGTMGNFLSVMSHCWGRGLEILVGDKSHIYIYEQGNVAQFGGVHSRALTNLPDGTFSTEELKAKIRPDDPHEPQTALICIENTHNKCGGKVVPLTWIRDVGQICRDAGLPLHCDGARLFNASVAMGISVKDLVKDCDSVSICLSKGLGAPIGSVIVGSAAFIQRAHRLRKAVGGGMRQSGIIASAGIYALDKNIERLSLDHQRARKIGAVFNEYGKGRFEVHEDGANSNLLFITINKNVYSSSELEERLKLVTSEERKSLGHAISILGIPFTPTQLRLSFHLDIKEEMMIRIEDKIKYVLQE
ncbi:hypothetical protein TCAL_04559 [Tigriopus californicus]|uniref:Aromatic amino acid beta-eliminating lyase/threonine aldolase domain-containing protein n=2 Tax=Tigriopus californicus TaxID=6832 RepID=A0A553PSB8_TIGCA|nr:hypothetical protein TCAL_04559 [Tigriopus californicus]